jgi:hypothetical protein
VKELQGISVLTDTIFVQTGCNVQPWVPSPTIRLLVVKLTFHLDLVPSLRINGVYLYSPITLYSVYSDS